jgi:hypothetical protein
VPLSPEKLKEIRAKFKTYPPEVQKEIRRQASEKLWRKGYVRQKFHRTQARIHDALTASREQQFYLLCSRRLGKTYMLLGLAFEQCLQKPNSRVIFLAPQAKDASDIATDVALHLLSDHQEKDLRTGEPIGPVFYGCPPDLRAKIEFKSQPKEFHFPNGSILRLKGVNAEQADSLRGGAVDLAILDECGQMDNLKYLVDSVVMPMTLTTNGRIYFATTPPITPDHESKVIYDDLFAKGATVKFTILDAPHISNEGKARLLKQLGESDADIPEILAGRMLPKTTAALRELFAEFVTDASQRVVPEFTREARAEIVHVVRPPAYYDTYVAMDPGFNDRTGILFAYYDFKKGNICIQAEALLHKASTTDIANAIGSREYSLWGDEHKPLLRVSDVDPRLIADLYERHGLVFVAAEKQRSLEALTLVRSMVLNREIEVDSSCVNLIHQLENTIWNKKASDFERTTDGHGDLLAALKYLCRHVARYRNPYPEGYGRGARPSDEFHSPRRRFWAQQNELSLGGSTPFERRVRKRRTKA